MNIRILVRYFQIFKSGGKKNTLIVVLIFFSIVSNTQQRIRIGIHADPLLSWFSTDIRQVQNNGARAGFSFGLTYNRYFTPNYSFSTGISLMRAGGRLVSSDTTCLLYTSDAADEEDSVDLGGRRII